MGECIVGWPVGERGGEVLMVRVYGDESNICEERILCL